MTLTENINRAVQDFDSIKDAIEDKGVEVGNLPTSEYAEKIGEIQAGQEVFYSNDGRCYFENVVIPEGTKSIGSYAFYGCSNLISIEIPNSVTTIGDWAFSKCSNLKRVAIPNGVTKIETNSFRYCQNLESINFPDSLTNIGSYAFESCRSLKSATIPNGVTGLPVQVFCNCTSMKYLYIPATVTTISSQAFSSCVALKDLVLGDGFNCTGLDVHWSPLHEDALVAMLVALADRTGSTAYTLTLGATNLAKLTAEQKQIATDKNWNLA